MLKSHTQIIHNHVFIMLPVQGGHFLMGSPEDDAESHSNERPQHPVMVSNFFIGQYPVTQALWKTVMKGENPSNFQGDEHPVEQVSWDDITQYFLPKLRLLTNFQYRLPTEAEWEYAARGGKYHIDNYKYAGSDRLKDVGWFIENSDGGTKPVGHRSANQLGTFDMSSNVWEWCEDDWHDNYEKAPDDGSAWIDLPPKRGSSRVSRGGSLGLDAKNCRIADRYYWRPAGRYAFLGFRLALTIQEDGSPLPVSQ